jgi:S1-C subfamily serine protease/pSer/pThr/pTyr-binding forkhead associated (FHA) protein
MSSTWIQPPHRLRLKPLEVAGLPRPVDLADGKKLRLGRASDNDVVLPADLFPSVSQHHCELSRTEGGIELDDLDSRNGTLVNGKPVKHAVLSAGDVIQLGALGPRFLVQTGNPLAETMFVDPKQVGVGSLTQGELKQALGVPEDVGIDELVRARSRANLIRVGVLVVLVGVAAALWGRWILKRGEADHERILALHSQVEEAWRQREDELARANALELSRQALEDEKNRLEADVMALQQRLSRLEEEGSSSAGELDEMRAELTLTRGELDSARDELRRFNPVDVEQARLTDVARVRSAIVLLEAVTVIVDVETGKSLHLAQEHGRPVPNFEDQGELVEFESTGSGFCISPEGWILTNAHVVLPMQDEPLLRGASGLPVEPRIVISAVFSGSDRRHPIEVVSLANGGQDDLALVRIEPFEGMPYIENFDPDVTMPAPGEDVYLFGFPLGNFALQQGDTAIASTFRGIVSRLVDGKLQVDAGVHPGNSGGPVTDAQGRVVGVVTSVQALPDQSAVYAIGYALPISDAKKLWPPPQ